MRSVPPFRTLQGVASFSLDISYCLARSYTFRRAFCSCALLDAYVLMRSSTFRHVLPCISFRMHYLRYVPMRSITFQHVPPYISLQLHSFWIIFGTFLYVLINSTADLKWKTYFCNDNAEIKLKGFWDTAIYMECVWTMYGICME